VLTTADFAAYRDRRLAEISSKSLSRQLSPVSNMFNLARKEWGIPLATNPLSDLRLPVIDNRRERRLRQGELDGLISAASRCRIKLILPTILFALETAMRRGKILAMHWNHVDLERRLVVIPEPKNGYSRHIPRTSEAVRLLLGLDAKTGKAFPIAANALRLSWSRLTRRAKIEDLNFHDLRHEAISRLFELGLTVPEVSVNFRSPDTRATDAVCPC
jgi:integrase